jgi:trk system potassium uptake protein TrkA
MKDNLRIIISGAGRVGLRAAHLLKERGHDVVVVEKDKGRCGHVSDKYVATVIHGDATRAEILEQTEPGKADAIAALTSDAEVNQKICLEALEQHGGLRTVIRSDEEQESDFDDRIDQVIYPEGLGALGAVNAILGTSVRALENYSGTLQILAVEIAEDAPVAGKTVAALSLPEGCLIVSDADANHLASHDTVLEAGKIYIVAVEPRVGEEVHRLLRG